jgi:hypothetical protein
MASTVSHASRTARIVESPDLAAGTWTSAQTGRGGSASVSIELARTSIVVPTVSTEAASTVVFTSETGHRTRATAGDSIELDAGSYTMDVSLESSISTTVGAYAAPLHDLTIQRHVDRDGNTGAITMAVNPGLVSSDIIEEMIGGPVRAASIILTGSACHLMVEGADATIMLQYMKETGEGRIGFGESPYGGEGTDRPGPDELIHAHGLDSREFEALLPEKIITVDTGAMGANVVNETLLMVDSMLAMGEYIQTLGRVDGFVGSLVGGAIGGFLGGASGGPLGAGAGSAMGRWAGSEFQDAVEAMFRDDDGDGTPNAVDNDMDDDGTPNHEDDDIDGDNTPNDEDDYPRDKTRSISAETEGPFGPYWLVDTPIGDENITFDIQMDSILNDLDALEDFGLLMSGTY